MIRPFSWEAILVRLSAGDRRVGGTMAGGMRHMGTRARSAVSFGLRRTMLRCAVPLVVISGQYLVENGQI